MAMKRDKLVTVLMITVVAWVALFYSGRGLLVWQWTDAGDHRLSCWYLAADGPFERNHLYTEMGLIGRSSCPRTVRLGR